MVYIKRDKDGQISAAYCQEAPGITEQVDIDSAEFVDFIMRCNNNERLKFMQSDLQFIRVLEDLIDILMDKNIINITDFPQPVIEKLLARQAFRKRLAGAVGMEYNDNVDET